jgi:EmrB/QacA subfamily drug resistance transporter
MCAAVVLIIGAVAGLNTVVPTIGRELGATQSQLTWVVDAFALALAALLLPMGALGDRYGRKRLMLIGFVILAGGSMAGAVVGSVDALIVTRAVAGVGAAMVFPGTLSTLTAAVPRQRRGQAIGLWTASASLGGTVGTLAAGLLVQVWWFGSVFVALGVSALVVGALTLIFAPESSDPSHAHLDPGGSLLAALGIGGVVLAVIEGPVSGWTSRSTVAAGAVGAIGLVGFVFWELRTDRPLLDVRLFTRPAFAWGTVSLFVQFLVVFGFFFTAAQFLGFVSDYGPLGIALALLPVGVLLPVLAARAPGWAARRGRGLVGAGGLLLMAVGAAVFATVGTESHYWVFAAALIVFGAGMGLAGPPATEAVIDALPAEKQGVASAVNDLARELGGAVGIAVLGTVLSSAYRASMDANITAVPAGTLEAVRDSAGAGLSVAAAQGNEVLAEAVRTALSHGFTMAMLVAAGCLVVTAVLVAWRTPRTLPAQPHDVTAREESSLDEAVGDAV